MIRPCSILMLLVALAGIGGCVSEEVRSVDMRPPDQSTRTLAEEELLDIGIAVFDANVPDDYDEQVAQLIQPDLRRAEANYMPYFLKNLLQSTGNWGAVRVVPRPTDAVDLTIEGRIVHSTGESLELEVTATDATGRRWLEKTYETLASKYAYDDTIPPDIDPFQAVYKSIANDLLAIRESMTDEDIRKIRRTAELKFARDFAPDAYEQHILATEDGRYEIRRLPADGDPMLDRVRQVREREYLFIDTLDEYYAGFHRNMYPAYQSWREASYDEALAYRQLRQQSRSRVIGGTAAIIGGVASIYESDNAAVDASGVVGVISGAMILKSAIAKRQEAELHAETLQELGVAAEAEVMPHTLDLENQTVRLQGSVEEQYDNLRRILRKLYFEDLGLPVPDTTTESEHDDAGT